MNYIVVNEKYELPFLKDVKQGEMALVESSGETFVYDGTNWNPVKIENNLQMQLYDMNKQIISQLGPLSEESIKESISLIDFFKNTTQNIYYMLYGKEIGYFTIFKEAAKPQYNETLGEAVIACLKNVGPVHSIELTEDKAAIEIWVKVDEEVSCFYLFPYDSGLVEFKR